jgi:MFS family permease
VPVEKRRAALGVQASAQAIGLASGPVTGGLLVAAVGWRWVFFLNVPVGLLAIVAGVYLLPRTRRRAESPASDPGGMVLLAASTTAGMLAISSASGLRMSPLAVAGCAAVAAVPRPRCGGRSGGRPRPCSTSGRSRRPGPPGR